MSHSTFVVLLSISDASGIASNRVRGAGRSVPGAGEGGGGDGVVDGEDEGQAHLDVVPRGAALDGSGGVDEHPRNGNAERGIFSGEREGED
jgi:hypothetical protein